MQCEEVSVPERDEPDEPIDPLGQPALQIVEDAAHVVRYEQHADWSLSARLTLRHPSVGARPLIRAPACKQSNSGRRSQCFRFKRMFMNRPHLFMNTAK
eukprot:scaffold9928_cov112-Isochrysis_galbana.AAC.14